MQQTNVRQRFNTHIFLALLFGVALFVNLNGCNGSKNTPSITVYGGAGQVSGSLSILETETSSYMIDCGAYYPHGPGSKQKRERRAARKNRTMPVNPEVIDGVFITHAHVDHIGRLPLLIRNGYDGPIYLTPATAKIAAIMLKMQVRFSPVKRTWTLSRAQIDPSKFSDGYYVKVHWHSKCKWKEKITDRNKIQIDGTRKKLKSRLHSIKNKNVAVDACEVCTKKEVSSIQRHFTLVNHGEPIHLDHGGTVTLRDAGHIPGSSSIVFGTSINNDLKKIIFSGDLGNKMSALQPGPSPLTDADMILVESTYGSHRRELKAKKVRKRFRRSVGQTIKKGGIAMIPAFALNRTHKMLYEMTLAKETGTIPKDTPIYCPSPTAGQISKLYRNHRREGWFREQIMTHPAPFDPPNLIEKPYLPESIPKPSILILTSGMLSNVYSKSLLPDIVKKPKNSVFLVGWQDPKSYGRALQEGAQEIEVNDKRVPVNANVQSFHCFSGHGDATDIDRWLSNVPKTTPLILQHGDLESLQERAFQLRNMDYKTVRITRPNKTFHLEKLLSRDVMKSK